MTSESSRWSKGRITALLAFAIVLVFSVAIVALDDGSYSEYCAADGILTEVPPGWDLSKDQANNCEWTLFDENGNRAPEDVYDGIPLDAPPVPIDILSLAAWLAIVASIGGIGFVLWDARRGIETGENPQ